MKLEILLILCIISACVGGGIGRFLFCKPLNIEFKISSLDSFMYAFAMFFVITMVMVLELSINHWQLVCFQPIDWRLRFLSRAIDGGLLVAMALPIMSILFGKWVIGFNLDLCRGYSITVVKVYYSLAIVANCIWFLVMAGPEIVNDDPEVQSILNRVVIWMLNVGGTWAGIGFHCEGRISEELKNIKRSKEKKTAKEILVYSIPFVIAFAINCLLLLVQTLDVKWMKEMFSTFYWIIMSGLVGMVVSVGILNYIKYPSERRSNQKLAKAISQVNDKEIVKGRYMTIQYSLINQESQKYLLIHERPVIWVGHEGEISNCFGERKEPIEKFNYEECKEYLAKLREDRRECVRKGYISCEEDVKKQLLEQSQE